MSTSPIKGQGAPGESTAGVVGQIYIDTDTGIQYECVESEKRTTHDFNKTYYNWIVRKLDASFLATKEEVKAGSGGSVVPQKVLFKSTDSEGNILCCGQKVSEMTIEEGLALCLSKIPYVMGAEDWFVTGIRIMDTYDSASSVVKKLIAAGTKPSVSSCGVISADEAYSSISYTEFKQS